MFSLEVYCRTAKLQVDGLVRSYGPQTLRIYRMSPELGPPELEERELRDRRPVLGARSGSTSPAAHRRRRAAARRPRRRALRLVGRRGRLRRLPGVRRARARARRPMSDAELPPSASSPAASGPASARRSRTRRSRCWRWPASRSRCTSSGCSPTTAPAGGDVRRLPRRADRRADRPRAFGIEIAYSFDGPGQLGTLGAIRGAADCSASASCPLRRHLPADRLPGGRHAVGAQRAPGADDRAAQRRALGHLQRRLRRTRIVDLRQARPDPGNGLDRLRARRTDRRRAGSCRSEVTDLADLLPRAARGAGELFGFAATERFYEIGTPAALAETGAFLAGQARAR